jgi:hypothetical protein
MGKRYIMVVDERIFLNDAANDNLSITGVVFEYDYCIGLKNEQCELRRILQGYKEKILNNNVNIYLDDIISKKNVYKGIDNIKTGNCIEELPQLLKGLKFNIISSSIKQDTDNMNEYYSIITNKLFKKFYSYIVRKNGEAAGIIMESRVGNDSYKIQQNFLDIYNNENIKSTKSIKTKEKMNTFVVCEKNNKTYGAGIEVLNIINNIFFEDSNALRKVNSKSISYIEDDKKDKIFHILKHKIYKDMQIGITTKQLPGISYNNIEVFRSELRILKEKLLFKELRINEKEREINELTDAIKLLNQQLEEALLSRTRDGVILKILSDIDFKMKVFENKSMASKY